jgi:hypothetical protein
MSDGFVGDKRIGIYFRIKKAALLFRKEELIALMETIERHSIKRTTKQ